MYASVDLNVNAVHVMLFCNGLARYVRLNCGAVCRENAGLRFNLEPDVTIEHSARCRTLMMGHVMETVTRWPDAPMMVIIVG